MHCIWWLLLWVLHERPFMNSMPWVASGHVSPHYSLGFMFLMVSFIFVCFCVFYPISFINVPVCVLSVVILFKWLTNCLSSSHCCAVSQLNNLHICVCSVDTSLSLHLVGKMISLWPPEQCLTNGALAVCASLLLRALPSLASFS